MSSVKHMMFFKKNVKTPLLLEVKVGFVYGLSHDHYLVMAFLYMCKHPLFDLFWQNRTPH